MTKNPSGASHYNPKSASADLCELQNAVVIPLAPNSNPNNVKGGVKSSRLDEKFLQCRWSAVHSSKASLETVTDLTYIQQWSGKLSHQKGRYLFGGPIFKNFGHFLAESIHRTWAYETQEKKNNVNYRGVILLPQNTKKLNFIQRLNYKRVIFGHQCQLMIVTNLIFFVVKSVMASSRMCITIKKYM